MHVSFVNCTQLLTRTKEKKFEDVLLVKIAKYVNYLNLRSEEAKDRSCHA